MTSVPTDPPPDSTPQQHHSPQAALYCARCSRPNAGSARFCNACGQPLITPGQIIAAPAQPFAAPLVINNTMTMAAPAPVAAPVVVVGAQNAGPGIVVRSLYFLFIGWWFGGLCLGLALALMGTVIGIPVGLLIINRLPQIMTLKLARTGTTVTVAGATPGVHSRVAGARVPPTSVVPSGKEPLNAVNFVGGLVIIALVLAVAVIALHAL